MFNYLNTENTGKKINNWTEKNFVNWNAFLLILNKTRGQSVVLYILLKATWSGKMLEVKSTPLCTPDSCALLSNLQTLCIFSPAPHSPSKLWTQITPQHYLNKENIHHPSEKLHGSCSDTICTPLAKRNPNNTHPLLISTSKPKRKLEDLTFTWTTLDLKTTTYKHTIKFKLR